MLLSNVWLDGTRVDIDLSDGLVTRLTPSEGGPLAGTVCPPFAEPHVHLDAALLGRRAPNRSGTLVEGIANWSRLRGELTARDLR